MDTTVITGGAGFIGSNFAKHMIKELRANVTVIDKLTYAGHIENLEGILGSRKFRFQQLDIIEKEKIYKLLIEHKPSTIFHLAAESHVDKSIDKPEEFVKTNVVGTHSILDASLKYWNQLNKQDKDSFRLIIVSTDEVFGSIKSPGLFKEDSHINPSSPYSASKAGADLIAMSYYKTYGLPVITTHCSNNYGPYQSPEKLIPLCVLKAINNQSIPIYGNGKQSRDWIHVSDHIKALIQVALVGKPGEKYCIGASNEISNIDIVSYICEIINTLTNRSSHNCCSKLISFTTDRPAHDVRYAIDNSKIISLGWKPKIEFKEGINQTVLWYLQNKVWVNAILEKNSNFMKRQGSIFRA